MLQGVVQVVSQGGAVCVLLVLQFVLECVLRVLECQLQWVLQRVLQRGAVCRSSGLENNRW